MVSPELRVGSLERWVSVGLWLLDTANMSSISIHSLLNLIPQGSCVHLRRHGIVAKGGERSYPLRCAFFDWLCWDEFFDSVVICQYKWLSQFPGAATYWPLLRVVLLDDAEDVEARWSQDEFGGVRFAKLESPEAV